MATLLISLATKGKPPLFRNVLPNPMYQPGNPKLPSEFLKKVPPSSPHNRGTSKSVGPRSWHTLHQSAFPVLGPALSFSDCSQTFSLGISGPMWLKSKMQGSAWWFFFFLMDLLVYQTKPAPRRITSLCPEKLESLDFWPLTSLWLLSLSELYSQGLGLSSRLGFLTPGKVRQGKLESSTYNRTIFRSANSLVQQSLLVTHVQPARRSSQRGRAVRHEAMRIQGPQSFLGEG